MRRAARRDSETACSNHHFVTWSCAKSFFIPRICQDIERPILVVGRRAVVGRVVDPLDALG